MKYYQIGITADPKIVGVKNGIYQVEIEKETMQRDIAFDEFLGFFDSKNAHFWESQDIVKTLIIPKIKAKLLKGAKITDIMGYTENISFFNELFSEKYINILAAFNIGDYSTFEVIIENVTEKYYLLFIKKIRSIEINFEKSLLYTGFKPRNYKVEYYKIHNYTEYREFKQNNPLAKFEKIFIPKKYSGLDIIDIQAINKPFYSEKLIDFLLDCGVTNIQVNNDSTGLEFE